MARASNPRNTVACLILGGLPGRPRPRQTAAATSSTGRPRPLAEDLEAVQLDRSRRPPRRARGRDPRQRPGPTPAPWSTAYGELGARRPRRSSTCCWATPSARTAPCTPRSTTAPSARSSPRPARPSAGGSSSPWPASPPASTAAPRRAAPRPASCSRSKRASKRKPAQRIQATHPPISQFHAD